MKRESQYEAMARQLSALPIDGFVVLCDFPINKGAIDKLLAGIKHTTTGKHLIISWRVNPSGGIKLIHVGSHGSVWNGVPEKRSSTRHPLIQTLFKKHISNAGQPPAAFYLGFMGNTQSIDYATVPRCKENGCAYPSNGNNLGLCHQHYAPFDNWEQIDRGIDHLDIWNKKVDEQSGHWPYFTTGWIGEDKTNWLNVSCEKSGHRVCNSKAEIQNDKWIQKNIIDAGLDATGIVVPKRKKSSDERKQAITIQQSMSSINSFFDRSREHEIEDGGDAEDYS